MYQTTISVSGEIGGPEEVKHTFYLDIVPKRPTHVSGASKSRGTSRRPAAPLRTRPPTSLISVRGETGCPDKNPTHSFPKTSTQQKSCSSCWWDTRTAGSPIAYQTTDLCEGETECPNKSQHTGSPRS